MDDVGPNPLVLEAQGKVCTGPTQTRPLDEEQCWAVLDAIIKSGEGTQGVYLMQRVETQYVGAFQHLMAVSCST